jgi:predicted SnoaL-like aldol condensation-catalyzing enzyme
MAGSHKAAALTFLRLAGSGKAREAFQRHVAPDFRHHNPWYKGDAESLMRGMEEAVAKFPEKAMEVQRVIEEGVLVAVHSHVRMKPGDRGAVVVHIFRFKDGRIAELWDLGQPAPENSVNEHGML